MLHHAPTHACSKESLTLVLHLHPRLSHVHLLVLQQFLRIYEERPTLQTLVLLALPHLWETLDGHGLLYLPFSFLASVNLLMDQHILQSVEELVALTAHVLMLHIHTFCLPLLLSHAGTVCVCVLSYLCCKCIIKRAVIQ